jgi:hypothetical protein
MAAAGAPQVCSLAMAGGRLDELDTPSLAVIWTCSRATWGFAWNAFAAYSSACTPLAVGRRSITSESGKAPVLRRSIRVLEEIGARTPSRATECAGQYGPPC